MKRDETKIDIDGRVDGKDDNYISPDKDSSITSDSDNLSEYNASNQHQIIDFMNVDFLHNVLEFSMSFTPSQPLNQELVKLGREVLTMRKHFKEGLWGSVIEIFGNVIDETSEAQRSGSITAFDQQYPTINENNSIYDILHEISKLILDSSSTDNNLFLIIDDSFIPFIYQEVSSILAYSIDQLAISYLTFAISSNVIHGHVGNIELGNSDNKRRSSSITPRSLDQNINVRRKSDTHLTLLSDTMGLFHDDDDGSSGHAITISDALSMASPIPPSYRSEETHQLMNAANSLMEIRSAARKEDWLTVLDVCSVSLQPEYEEEIFTLHPICLEEMELVENHSRYILAKKELTKALKQGNCMGTIDSIDSTLINSEILSQALEKSHELGSTAREMERLEVSVQVMLRIRHAQERGLWEKDQSYYLEGFDKRYTEENLDDMKEEDKEDSEINNSSSLLNEQLKLLLYLNDATPRSQVALSESKDGIPAKKRRSRSELYQVKKSDIHDDAHKYLIIAMEETMGETVEEILIELDEIDNFHIAKECQDEITFSRRHLVYVKSMRLLNYCLKNGGPQGSPGKLDISKIKLSDLQIVIESINENYNYITRCPEACQLLRDGGIVLRARSARMTQDWVELKNVLDEWENIKMGYNHAIEDYEKEIEGNKKKGPRRPSFVLTKTPKVLDEEIDHQQPSSSSSSPLISHHISQSPTSNLLHSHSPAYITSTPILLNDYPLSLLASTELNLISDDIQFYVLLSSFHQLLLSPLPIDLFSGDVQIQPLLLLTAKASQMKFYSISPDFDDLKKVMKYLLDLRVACKFYDVLTAKNVVETVFLLHEKWMNDEDKVDYTAMILPEVENVSRELTNRLLVHQLNAILSSSKVVVSSIGQISFPGFNEEVLRKILNFFPIIIHHKTSYINHTFSCII